MPGAASTKPWVAFQVAAHGNKWVRTDWRGSQCQEWWWVVSCPLVTHTQGPTHWGDLLHKSHNKQSDPKLGHRESPSKNLMSLHCILYLGMPEHASLCSSVFPHPLRTEPSVKKGEMWWKKGNWGNGILGRKEAGMGERLRETLRGFSRGWDPTSGCGHMQQRITLLGSSHAPHWGPVLAMSLQGGALSSHVEHYYLWVGLGFEYPVHLHSWSLGCLPAFPFITFLTGISATKKVDRKKRSREWWVHIFGWAGRWRSVVQGLSPPILSSPLCFCEM